MSQFSALAAFLADVLANVARAEDRVHARARAMIAETCRDIEPDEVAEAFHVAALVLDFDEAERAVRGDVDD